MGSALSVVVPLKRTVKVIHFMWIMTTRLVKSVVSSVVIVTALWVSWEIVLR
jgi:hypothetical protein